MNNKKITSFQTFVHKQRFVLIFQVMKMKEEEARNASKLKKEDIPITAADNKTYHHHHHRPDSTLVSYE